jgi:hypothetical protein
MAAPYRVAMQHRRHDPAPIEGLDDCFPPRLYVLRSSDGRYGCAMHDGYHGLACFSGPAAAMRWADAKIGTGEDAPCYRAEGVTFDHAREIAKGRPAPVRAIYLLDDWHHPVIHWVN